MRVRAVSEKGLVVRAVAGTYVVLLGFDIAPAQREGLLGFSVLRKDANPDPGDSPTRWLCGKIHPEAAPQKAGEEAPTNVSPIQKFRWADYTAKPKHQYTYVVEALYGALGNLTAGDRCEVTVTMETPCSVGSRGHQVHFNRCAAASQAYVQKFGDKDPDEVPDRAAYIWLSRGLEESLIDFINQAKDSTHALHLCVYEFQKDEFLTAIRQAVERGVQVQAIYDAIPNSDGPKAKNEAAMTKNGLKFGPNEICRGRTGIPSISHNKFIVFSENGQPKAVWTGSTNFTDGAIYGQANVGHAIANSALAKQYLDLHQILWNTLDANTAASRKNAETLSPVPPTAVTDPVLFPVFSPRSKIIAIEQCAELINNAKELVCLTAPFPLHPDLRKALEDVTHPCLKFALLNADNNLVERVSNAPGSGQKPPVVIPDNLRYAGAAALAMPAHVHQNKIDVAQQKMLQGDTPDDQLAGFQNESLHHQGVYIHTKIIVVDPLSEDPIIVTGSANFSDNSSRNNDENQLFIHGEPEVADVYLTEFMRLYDHYAFRDFMKRSHDASEEPHLSGDDSWTKPYFDDAGLKVRDRQVFSL